MTVKELQTQAHTNSKSKGFWDKSDSPLSKLMLIVTELAEAAEEYRSGNSLEMVYYTGEKPEGFGMELADAMIRLADLAEAYGLDLEELIQEKMTYNKTRPAMHGKVA